MKLGELFLVLLRLLEFTHFCETVLHWISQKSWNWGHKQTASITQVALIVQSDMHLWKCKRTKPEELWFTTSFQRRPMKHSYQEASFQSGLSWHKQQENSSACLGPEELKHFAQQRNLKLENMLMYHKSLRTNSFLTPPSHWWQNILATQTKKVSLLEKSASGMITHKPKQNDGFCFPAGLDTPSILKRGPYSLLESRSKDPSLRQLIILNFFCCYSVV